MKQVNIELEDLAWQREKNRLTRMQPLLDKLPKRKSGELAGVCAMLEAAHKTLCGYDRTPSPPPISGITETWFDAALERVAEIVAAAQANPEG